MATYTLTGSNSDNLVGANGVADLFLVNASGHLVSTDTVNGGSGAVTDTLRITTAMTFGALAFSNVRGIERVEIVGGAVRLSLADAMAASANGGRVDVVGGTGADTILGGSVLSTALYLSGGDGADMLEGGGGNDSLAGGKGADSLLAGAGSDTLRGGDGLDTISIALGEFDATDRIEGGLGNDVLLLASGGTLGATRFATGVSGIEAIAVGAAETDGVGITLPGSLSTGGVPMTITGALGGDTVNATGVQTAFLMDGGAGNDHLTGGGLADSLVGGTGNDSLFGNNGDDTVDGGDGNDRLGGGAGNDLLLGGAGDDTMTAGAGADTLDLGTGFDRVDGGGGNDLYRVLATQLTSSDLIADEAGAADTLEILDVFNTLTFSFSGISISGALAGRIQGIERFLLGSGNDTILATSAIGDSAGANVVTVSGGAGNDRLDVSQVVRLTTPLAFLLDGGEGADSLVGGRGADTLSPGSGDDRVTGGLGNDVFLVLSAELGAGDTLDGETGTDTLRLIGNEALGSDRFAGLAGIEIVELADGGQAITLPGAFADALGFTMATIRGGDGDDLVDVGAFAAGRRVTVELGDGDDTLFGGAGNDSVFAGAGVDAINVGAGVNRVTFAVGELSALDIVTASTASAFDTLVVSVAAGQTLTQGALAGVSGFDTFNFNGGEGSAVRLPGTLVSQSGQSSVNVNVTGGSMAVDGRALASAFRLDGGSFNDTLFGGSGADTLLGNGGDDVHVGGFGGDRIFLGTSTTSEDIALLRSVFDGTADINITQSVAGADSVSGTEFEGNFIKVDRFGFGLADSTTWFVGAAQNISLNYSAARLEDVSIAGDDFGSLTDVRNAVGSRFTNNTPDEFEKLILVITGSSATRFGVYYFEDRDDNATVDSTDLLRLLAVGTGAGPTFSGNSGFRLTSEFELL
jgi:Ca2+-binding RTX toxin-like protein